MLRTVLTKPTRPGHNRLKNADFRPDHDPSAFDSEAAPEEEKHQPMEGGLPSEDEEVLLPNGKEWEEARINCEYSESTVLPVHHQALLIQHQASPQAKNS